MAINGKSYDHGIQSLQLNYGHCCYMHTLIMSGLFLAKNWSILQTHSSHQQTHSPNLCTIPKVKRKIKIMNIKISKTNFNNSVFHKVVTESS